ncbi:pseudouridine synthase [Marinobacteraceae bacterium S3BR75-40.1]
MSKQVPDVSPSESLPILYQDQWLVAVHKPAGLLVHRSEIDRRETRFAMAILREQLGRKVFPVHRLDKPTSGILLFALDRDTAASVAIQFENHAVRKRYLTVVRGYPPLGGIIRHPLSVKDDRRSRKTLDVENQSALTCYHRLARAELPFAVDKRYPASRYSLVALHPRTGRRHQLRRHMKHISHPIIGDSTYGKGNHNRFFRDQFNVDRLLLAATNLQLKHPVTGEALHLEAKPSQDFQTALEALGWHHQGSPPQV